MNHNFLPDDRWQEVLEGACDWTNICEEHDVSKFLVHFIDDLKSQLYFNDQCSPV